MLSIAERIDDPSLCVVHIGKGERITGLLGELLNPVNSESFHEYRLPANLKSSFTITITMNIGYSQRAILG